MQLPVEFIRLPLRFDPSRLAEEVRGLAPSAWRQHPGNEPGNTAVQLVAANGDPDDDATKGPMRPTSHLAQMPYTRQVVASLGAVVGRTRLMRVEAEGHLQRHTDLSYYWRDHVRVHVPVATSPGVRFHCGGATAHMGAGETWVFDTWRPHGVENPAGTDRIHLVVDTVGSSAFWELVDAGEANPGPGTPGAGRFVPFDPDAQPQVAFETVNRSTVMSPWEQRAQLDAIVADLNEDALVAALRRHERDWRGVWALHGDGAAGWPAYRRLLHRLSADLEPFRGRARLPNGTDAVKAILSLVVEPALNPERAPAPGRAAHAELRARRPVRGVDPVRIDRPVFVVSPPRSGSTLLFETLARSPDAWTVGGESHDVFESIRPLAPAERGWDSNRLEAKDAYSDVVAFLTRNFIAKLRDRDGKRPAPGADVRLVEKTPKNALRVPFLAKAYPDARFVYLYRDPRETISSMLDAWRSGRFVTYPSLPGWAGPPWSLLLVPGWRDLPAEDLPRVVAEQWRITVETLLDDLEALEAERWCVTSYDRLLDAPQQELERLCEFCDLAWDEDLAKGALPISRHTLDSPRPEKWRRNGEQLRPVLPSVEPTALRAHRFFADPPRVRPRRPPATTETIATDDDAAKPPSQQQPFHSVFTSNLPPLLARLGVTPLVTTYQSGRLIAVRTDGQRLNTHFRMFNSPMGLATSGPRLALGTKGVVWHFRNVPSVAARLEPAGVHDACFLPSGSHVTGDIAVHELVYVDGELWVVNTRFSCLATLHADSSFVPRWRPPFVTALAAQDRCHLNGVAVVDGGIGFVTALGATNEAGGWRANKARGGVVLAYPSGDIVAEGLSMPHSPRWHDGSLWVLESGEGRLCTVDVSTGERTMVAELPGFTRGLAFAGPYAVVGLSKVRESIFGGIPIADRLDEAERECGLWVVDTRDGTVAGFMRFDGAVQEIFDVQLLHGIRMPELIEPEAELTSGSFVLPEDAMADVEG